MGTTLPDVSSILNPSSPHLASPSRASFTHSPVQTHFPLRNASFDEQTSWRRNLRTSAMYVISVSFKDSGMRTGAGESSGETEDSMSDHSELSPRVGTHIRPAPARVYSDPTVGRYDTRRHSYPSPIDSLLPSDPISRRTSPRRGSLLGQSRQEDYQTREESLQLQSQAPFPAPIARPSDVTLPPLDFGNISKTRNAAAFSAPVPVIASRGPNTYEPVVDQADDEYDDDVSDDDGDDEYTPSISHR
ncbi:hypothetical protein FA15DRAFT_710122 [Coprinopsis marcescibilis]|uniref:Uncharacterized protein n=1 Tax=Coprinopsis marcescibilis TaxID=230819 RepID=A0A5C3KDT9_COPMA|nr:hypothetical protein FA15DRAFT_710122 [Coprinopsis marcescibilis]